jgi:hypothetical protein
MLCVNAPVVTKFLCVGVVDSNDDVQLVRKNRHINDYAEPKTNEVISYWAISNDFQNMLYNWFQLGLDREIRDAIVLYLESQSGESATEITFLLLFQACEGIAKRVEPIIYRNKTAKCLLSHFLRCTATPLLSFLDNAAIEKLSHTINETRKYWIHNSGKVIKADTFDGYDLLAINRLLSYTLRVYLLTRVGVSQDVITHHLTPYQGIGTFLLEELKAMCTTNRDTQVSIH